MNWTLVILIVCGTIGFLTLFDILTYMLKRTPKSAMFARLFWVLGFIGLGVMAYWFFNGQTF